MKVEQISEERLKKVFFVSETAEKNKADIEFYIKEKAKTVKIDGFRPGKAPIEKVRAHYEGDAFNKVITNIIKSAKKEILSQIPGGVCIDIDFEGEPKIDDFAFEANFFAYANPSFDLCDLSSIDIEDYKFDVLDDEISKKMETIAKHHNVKKTYPDDHVAGEDDRVVITLSATYGKNKSIKGYNTKRASIVISASNTDQEFLINHLRNKTKGSVIDFEQTFSRDYVDTRLSSKTVHFQGKVLEIYQNIQLPVGEDLAKDLQLESLEKWREKVKLEAQSHYDGFSNICKRRKLLDSLSEKHVFDVPDQMVTNEFQNIWSQLDDAEKSGAEDGKTPAEIKQECEKLANRRVRLGFVVKKLSEALNVKIYKQDYENAIWKEAMRSFDRYGWEAFKMVSDFYEKNPSAYNRLISMILEEKTVTALLERVTLIPVEISLEDLKKKVDEVLPDFWQDFNTAQNNDESPEDESCDHHEGCGHNH